MASVEPLSATAQAPAEERRAIRLGPRATRALATTVFGVLLLAVWQIVGSNADPITMSYPTAVVERAGEMISDGTLLDAFGASLQPFIPGYLLAVVVGIPLGLVIGRYRIVEAAVGPYVTAGYSTPLVALIPLFIVWFGIGLTSKIWLTAMMAFFLSFFNTYTGVGGVEPGLKNDARVMGASRWQIFWRIQLPLLKPVIIIAVVIRGMEALKLFDQSVLLTFGGPGTATQTIAFYLWRQVWQFNKFSFGAAASILLLFLFAVVIYVGIYLLVRERATLRQEGSL